MAQANEFGSALRHPHRGIRGLLAHVRAQNRQHDQLLGAFSSRRLRERHLAAPRRDREHYPGLALTDFEG